MTICALRTMAPLLTIALAASAIAAPKKAVRESGPAIPVLWQAPADISTRDMIAGPGGAEHQPKGPFKFLKEDTAGSNPKYTIEDANGSRWKLKLGEEAHPETAASRIVWAAGYYADTEYFVPDIKVDGVPSDLHRGGEQVEPDGLMHNARLKLEPRGSKKEATWKWKENPFTGTREFNGLRVMMALINNWDLKDVNNAIIDVDGRKIYYISDLGASFGTTGLSTSRAAGKGNLENYTNSKFIDKVTETTVSFGTPSRPALINFFAERSFKQRVDLEWIGKDIPIADARWIGSVLSKLSLQQLQAAFEAAGYSPKEIVGFSNVLAARIAELNHL
jgi:hypothetical protein